ncbi:unnamed protein product [Closterium sp. NIES-53]
MVTRANDIRAANTTPRRPTPSKPLKKLLGRQGLAPTLLLLPLATTITPPLNSSTPTATTAAATTPTAATTTTPTAATTATTEAPSPATTPTAATTSATSTASTASTTTTTAATATTPATLALAAAALPTKSRSSPDILSTKDVNSSSRSVGGGKGGGGTPLKERRARSATSSTYSDYASLSWCEVLLEQVDSEVCGVKCEKVVPDCAKRVREASDYEVESDVHRGWVPIKELCAVASVASAEVGNKVLVCGKG